MGNVDNVFMYVVLSHVFLNFESSLVIGVPVGLVFIILLLSFVIKIFSLGDVKYFLSSISYHFCKFFYPRSWFMVSLFIFIGLMNVFRLVPRSFSLSSLPLITLRIRVVG